MVEISVPILIVGGGGTGLSTSIFLSSLGIESLLVERHSATSHLPKAHYMHQRTMEIFRAHGIADEIYAAGAPRCNSGKIVFCTSLGGNGHLDGRTIAALDIMGGGDLAPLYDLHGTAPPVHIPQILLEPVLRCAAERLAPSQLLFNHELVSLKQDSDGVDAIVRDRINGTELTVRAQYVISADGGKTVGPKLGVSMVGQTKLADYVSVHFGADLSSYIHDDVSVMRVILSPRPPEDRPTVGTMLRSVLLAFGPDRWDRHNSSWTLAWAEPFGSEPLPPEQIASHIQRVLKVDAPITVHNVNHWALESIIADKFRVERVFLAGDAAHKHTPAGGLGLNSGIQDAHNLSWKLALALKGKGNDGLLNSYEVERRPVVTDNAAMSVLGTGGSGIVLAALGVDPNASISTNEEQLSALLAETIDGARRRARMYDVLRFTRTDYGAQDNDLGYNYHEGALVDDHSPPPVRDLMGAHYSPTTRPGCRLPHIWLTHEARCLSTHDLIPIGGFALLTGTSGFDWCAAAQKIAAENGVQLKAYRLGCQNDVDIFDASGDWQRVREISDEGAILVRPDGFVGYRSLTRVDDPAAELRSALAKILAGGGHNP